MAKPNNLDPKNINGRLYNQIHRMLEQCEDEEIDKKITIRERIALIIAVARIQTVFVALRKEKTNDDAIAGSKVRQYAGTFQAHDPRRRAKNAGAAAVAEEPEPDDELGLDSWDDEPDDA